MFLSKKPIDFFGTCSMSVTCLRTSRCQAARPWASRRLDGAPSSRSIWCVSSRRRVFASTTRFDPRVTGSTKGICRATGLIEPWTENTVRLHDEAAIDEQPILGHWCVTCFRAGEMMMGSTSVGASTPSSRRRGADRARQSQSLAYRRRPHRSLRWRRRAAGRALPSGRATPGPLRKPSTSPPT